MDKSVAFGLEVRGYKSFHRRSTVALDCPLFYAALNLKNDIHYHFINKGTGKITVKGVRLDQVGDQATLRENS